MKLRLLLAVICIVSAVAAFGQAGNTLNFDGVDDKVTIADNNLLDFTGTYTLECWFKADAFTQFDGLVSKYQSSGANGFTLRLSGTAPYTGLNFDGLETPAGILQAGQWYHVAAVNNNGTRTLYLNGVAQTLTGTGYTAAVNADAVTIGIDYLASPRYFHGDIDEVRLWNAVRTPAQIQANMNAPVSATSTGLVAYFQFNQGNAGSLNATINTLADATGNGLNGILSGFARNGNTSNWVGSFAMVSPSAATATGLGGQGFSANWNAPVSGVTDHYLLDVSTSSSFSTFVTGYNQLNAGNVASYAITGLQQGTKYYYRLKAVNALGDVTVYGNTDSATTYQYGTALYVNQAVATSGDGQSWATAVKNLSDAFNLLATYPGIDSILVAGGTYYPAQSSSSLLARDGFVVNDRGVKLYGGYAPDGSGMRNIASYPTYLDGNFNQDNIASNNSYSVLTVYISSSRDSIVVDGLTLQNGYGDDDAIFTTGGGLNLKLSNNNNVAVRNCIFKNNVSLNGGAVELLSGATITNCTFSNNTSFNEGGAVDINALGDTCIFNNCIFNNNVSSAVGGAAYTLYVGLAQFNNCSFANNTALNQAGAVGGEQTQQFFGCTFTGNRTTRNGGGALYFTGSRGASHYYVYNCRFNNDTAGFGGAIRAVTNANCLISGNLFSNSIATDGGGGALSFDLSVTDTIINNLFIYNRDVSTGASQGGGAVNAQNSSSYIVNNTFYADSAVNAGGAVHYLGNSGSMQVYNNIFYKCNAANGSDIQNDNAGGTFTAANNSLNNITPFFKDETNPIGPDNAWGTADDGLRLLFVSPALNAGDTSKLPAGYTTDFTGAARVQSTGVDEGAYEGILFTGNTVYVNKAAIVSGDGTSWAAALRELRDGIVLADAATSVKTVLVAGGTYYPAVASRDSSFEITRGGLKIVGGYNPAGNGVRDTALYHTYLDGDLGVANTATDNSKRIVYIHDIGSGDDSLLFDGVTIRNAYSETAGGSGIYIANAGNKLAIINSTITTNYAAANGGGVYFETAGGITFENCAFTKNTAANGGAMAAGTPAGSGGNIVVNNCSFTGNLAGTDGGAINFTATSASISSSRFTSNKASGAGGGIYTTSFSGNSMPGNTTITGCVFTADTAVNFGGGAVFSERSSNIKAVNNVFFANVTVNPVSNGGAMYVNPNASYTDTLLNNLFIRNKTLQAPSGALGLPGASHYVVNNTFYADTAYGTTGGAINVPSGGPVVIYNNIFYKNYAASRGPDVNGPNTSANNSFSNTNPQFVNEANPIGPDGIWGTADDGLRLLYGSSALNAGDNSKLPTGTTTDITGSARIAATTVDLGAYEGAAYSSTVLHVNQSAAVNGDGTSWASPVKELRDAIGIAATANNIDSIVVAGGTYYPAVTSRDSSFEITRGGLKLIGGYAINGSGVRDTALYHTYLDGDINMAGTASDNSKHIVYIHGIGAMADSIVLDGFTVRNGSASALYLDGVANLNKTLMRNCNFTNNTTAGSGGAVFCYQSAPAFAGCTFTANSSMVAGGAVYFEYGDSSLFYNCAFSRNSSNNYGGAISAGLVGHLGGYISITGCRFTGNSVNTALANGGALFLSNSTGNSLGVVSRCSFTANKCKGWGGAIFTANNSITATVTLSGNVFTADTALTTGGAIYCAGTVLMATGNVFKANVSGGNGGAIGIATTSTDTLINNLFIQNTATRGSGVYPVNVTTTYMVNNTFYANNISTGGVVDNFQSGSLTAYNNVFYKTIGGADIFGPNTSANNSFSNTDPKFVNENNPPGADGIWATADDGLHLAANSQALNAGDNSRLPASANTDLSGAARITAAVVDLGAYEGTPAITASLKGDTTACQGSAAYVTFSVHNGIAPYTFIYRINAGAVQTISTTGGDTLVKALIPSATPGSFTCTLIKVTDNTGDTALLSGNDTLHIIVKGKPTATLYGSNAGICNKGFKFITIKQVRGGTLPYTYSFDGGATYQDTTRYKAVAGNYTAIVKDAAGCMDTTNTITLIDTAKFTMAVTEVSNCAGDAGTLTINATGGYGKYGYSIDSVHYQPDNTFNVQVPATYRLFVKDSAGCLLKKSFITAPMVAHLSQADSAFICNAGIKTVKVRSVINGHAPYQYSIDGGTTYQDSAAFKAGAGNVAVTVKDAAGCVTVTNTLTLVDTATLVLTLQSAVNCVEDNSTITLHASGGYGNYVYAINSTDYQAGNVIAVSVPGSYTAYVKDNMGCKVRKNFTVAHLSATLTTSRNQVCGTQKARLNTITKGGMLPYLYSLDGGSTYQDSSVFQVGSGFYRVVVKDGNGCTAGTNNLFVNPCQNKGQGSNVKAEETNTLVASGMNKSFTVKVMPNPAVVEFTLSIQNGDDEKQVEIRVMDMNGRMVYQSSGTVFDTYKFGARFAAGIYVAEVINGNNIQRIKLLKAK